MIADYEKRRDRVLDHLSLLSEIDVIRPDGGFCFFPGCGAIIGKLTPEGRALESDVDACEYLLENAAVVKMLGSAFGAGPALRLAYTISPDAIDQAFERIGRALRR